MGAAFIGPRFLVLLVLPAALLLAAACSGGAATSAPTEGVSTRLASELTDEEPQAEANPIPAETQQVEATPTLIPTVLNNPDVDYPHPCLRGVRLRPLSELTEEEQRIHKARAKTNLYELTSAMGNIEDLILAQPTVHGYGIGSLLNADGELLNSYGIRVWVEEKTAKRTLPQDSRLPDCYRGIPIQIIEMDPDIGYTDLCIKEISTKLVAALTQAELEELQERFAADWGRMRVVLDKYRALFEGYPNYEFAGIGHFRVSWHQVVETYGIVLVVTEMVDPEAVPEDKRIPDCLEGVPVQIVDQRFY